MLKIIIGLIWNIVKRFLNRGYDAEELYQIGCMGFIKAIKRFDTSLDVQVSTYAVPYIMGEIKKFIRDDGIIKVSRGIKELSVKIKVIQNQYQIENNEEISINDLAQKLNVSKEDIIMALDSQKQVESIYKEEENQNNDSRTLIDKIPVVGNEELKIVNKLTVNKMIKDLEKREQQIILLRYYKDKTQSQVGKILGISQVQVSRLEKSILNKMKNMLEAV